MTKATYFQATIKSIAENSSKTVVFLNDDEIFAPRTSVKNLSKIVLKPQISFHNGILNISTNKMYSTLKVFDLNGKVLLCLDLKRYQTGNGNFRIPLAALLAKIGNRKLIVKLMGNSIETFTFFCGGVR